MTAESTFSGPFKPGDTVDRYVIERSIGGGGAALVYLVRHVHLETRCALKVLAGPAMPQQTERILREGRVQAKLRHPNLVRVIDAIEVMGAPALVMEYVEGPTLAAWLHAHRPSLREAESLFRGIVAAVAEAHRHGLVHRDLKPANVMLARVHGRLEPRVMDFGLVKVYNQDERLTQTGSAAGTPRYMAPEQILDATDVDARTDVFALGAILYELVTGKRAFEGDNAPEVLSRTLAGAYRPPRDHVVDLPDRVVRAIDGCLAVDRRQRLSSCETLLGVLDHGLDTWETLLPPVTMSVPAARPARNASLRLAVVLLFGASLPVVGAALLLLALGRAPRDAEVTDATVAAVLPVTAPDPPPAEDVAPVEAAVVEPVSPPPPRAASQDAVVAGPSCAGRKRELLGWTQAPAGVVATKGMEWEVTAPRNVRADHPKADNGFVPGAVVCVLASGQRVKATRAPVEVPGWGTWVPITGGTVDRKPGSPR